MEAISEAEQANAPACDWCNQSGAWKTEVYPYSMMFVYACADHRQKLEAYEETRPKRRRFR